MALEEDPGKRVSLNVRPGRNRLGKRRLELNEAYERVSKPDMRRGYTLRYAPVALHLGVPSTTVTSAAFPTRTRCSRVSARVKHFGSMRAVRCVGDKIDRWKDCGDVSWGDHEILVM